MKRTNKITLALLVFFVGVMITACGSKNSSNTNNTTNNNDNDLPTRFEDCHNSCNDVDGRFYIDSDRLYREAFDLSRSSSSGLLGNSGFVNSIAYSLADVIDPIGDVFHCGGVTVLARGSINLLDDIYERIFGDDPNTNQDITCVSEDTRYFSRFVLGEDDEDLRDNYPATIAIDDDRNDDRVYIQLTIENSDTGTERMVFRQRRNEPEVFDDTSGRNLLLVHRSNRLELSSGSILIGWFQD